MATITKPMALDESFNTTESTPRNQADVLVGIETAIRQGFGQVASAVEYDNTDSGLTAENVQDAIDEVDDTVDGIANDVAEISSDIESTQTISGNPLTLTDCAPINAESLVVELEPHQDLHGQSAPYVGGAGKNKCPIDLQNGNTGTGMSWTIKTDADGNKIGIVLNGTHVDSSRYFATVASMYLESGNYYLSGAYNDNAALELIGDGVDIYNNNAENPTAFTISTSGTYTLYLAINTNVALSNAELKPMIRLATETDPTFAPYSNICPITGYTECEVDDVGKNLFDYTQFLNADGWTESNGVYSGVIYDLYAYSGYGSAIPVQPDWEANTVYTLSLYNVACTGLARFRVQYTDGTFDDLVVYSDSVGNYISITTAENKTVDNLLFTYNNGGDLSFKEFQIEKSASRTQFQPYHSSNATIQFGQTVYGGKSNVTDGGTSNEIAFIKDTHITNISEGVDGNADWLNVVFTTDINILPSDTVEHRQELAERSTSNYSGVWEYENVNGHVHFYSGGLGKILAFYPKSVFPTLSDFTTYYANNKAEFAIPYDTSSTIATPPTDLKLLKGTNNITTNGTTINLGYQPDNVVGDAKEKADKINFSEIVKYTISGNTADLIPLVIDGTAHNNIPIVTDITKYRMLCVELVLKPSTAITGVYFSAIAFTDGIYLSSGISIPVYRPSDKFYASVTINPDGNGGFKLSYTAINQSQSTPPDYYSIRVRAFNQY